MSLDDWDVPEFVLPTIMECNNIIPLREQASIERAAGYAHHGQHRAAHEYRVAAGYGGCDDNDKTPFASI